MMPGGLTSQDARAAAGSGGIAEAGAPDDAAGSTGAGGSAAQGAGQGRQPGSPHPGEAAAGNTAADMGQSAGESPGMLSGSTPAQAGQQSTGERAGELRSGPFRLSAAERRLWKGGEEIVLTPTEWTLVLLLMEREGEGLSRDDILDAVWGRHFIGDLKIVDVNIRRIRQKLEDEPSDPRYIETLWGFGYRWKRSGF
ncbi:winged helix-turn-helix domain-containing protein [Paenibacillus sepulcri]